MAQADGARLALIDGRALVEKTVVDSQTLSWLTRRNSIKSLPRNAIAGFGRPDVEFGWRQQDGCAEHVALQQRISSASATKKRGEAGRQKLSDFRVDFFHDGNGSIKSLQRDVVAGRWVTG